MKKEDVKLGMKVVPFQKTRISDLGFSYTWDSAKFKQQPYLFVTQISPNEIVLSDVKGDILEDYKRILKEIC